MNDFNVISDDLIGRLANNPDQIATLLNLFISNVMIKATESVENPIECKKALTDIVNATEAVHGTACMKAIMSLYEGDIEANGEAVYFRSEYMRDFTEACCSDFVNNLRANISDACKRSSVPDFMDPNHDLVVKILAEADE
jgi:hypothetical protein